MMLTGGSLVLLVAMVLVVVVVVVPADGFFLGYDKMIHDLQSINKLL